MKKKSIITITALAIAILPIILAASPNVAHADALGTGLNYLIGGTAGIVYGITGLLSQLLMYFSGAFLAICGVLLNTVMILTLHMKDLVDQTTAIGIAWRTVRDFSSIFIIFMLLYASITMILGIKGPSLGALIKTIVIAGLLINFSLYITKFLVDTSNIISLSFYSAIAPTSAASSSGIPSNLITSAFSDGGISNVFMQSLNIQQVPGSAQALKTADPSIGITLANVGGSVLMITAALSFLAAAIMFTIRIGVLILLMAFSPIYFIAMIVPEVKQYADKWSKMLYSMCVFMPVYLFLMYVAVSILNDKHFFSFINAPAGSNTDIVSAHTVGIVMQYILAFIMINAPLLAAVSIANEGASFVSKIGQNVKKWGQGVVSGGSKWAWRQTGSRAANYLAESDSFKNAAGKSVLSELALKGTRAVGGNYAAAKSKRVEGQTQFADSLGHDERAMAGRQAILRGLKDDLATNKARMASEKALGRAANPATIASIQGDIDRNNRDIKYGEARALDIETKRQVDYSTRTGSGLWNTALRRSNKTASAKVEVSVIEKLMKKAKENLKDDKDDLKSLEKAIKNNRGGPTTAQTAESVRLAAKIASGTAAVNAHEDRIDQLKLEK